LSEPKDPKVSKEGRAGRVRHDASGRAIWEWAVDTGRHALDSTSRLLKRLDLPGLSLLDEEKEKQRKEQERLEAERDGGGSPYGENDPRRGTSPGGATPGRNVPTFGGPRESDPMAGARRSFNPYDSRTPARGATKPVGKPVPRITQPVRPARKPGLLGRLFGKK
jgi:hypothetical protein